MDLMSASTLEGAVAAIYPDIEEQVRSFCGPVSERDLWKELSLCLLSSQIPFAVALSASNAIENARLLPVDTSCSCDQLAARLENLLSRPLMVDGRPRHYRFPRSKAIQLAQTWERVRAEAGTLDGLLRGLADAEIARAWLVRFAPGLGPKQASMFLRNIGLSYDLAVLDRHVLHYMNAVGLSAGTISGSDRGPSSYYNHERRLRAHAVSSGYRVGVLDWAIWIVMRAVRDLQTRER